MLTFRASHLLSFQPSSTQTWGGSGTVLVPTSDGAPNQIYRDELIRSDVDRLDTRTFSEEVEAPGWIDHGMGRPYPALLIADGLDRDKWSAFHIADLEPDDPWKPIYAATVGLWPTVPSEEMFPKHFYDTPPESFELFFEVQRETIVGSLRDLIQRLINRSGNVPRLLSRIELSGGLAPNTGYISSDRLIPNREETRTAAGPNIIVVFGDDAVADGALLWNLRGSHTSGYALPIGIPKSMVTREAFAELRVPGRFAAFGLGGGGIYLTSASVPLEELNALAEVGMGIQVAPHEALLTFGTAPARRRSQLATFTEGRAKLVPETDDDQKIIYPFGARGGQLPELQFAVSVDGNYVPTSLTLRGDRFGPKFAGGAAQLQVPTTSLRNSRSLEVEWPTPWLRLECVARDRSMDVEVSSPGYAAIALIEALGGIEEIQWLAHPGLVALLYRLAERSGMTWWKRRWSDARKEIGALGIDKAAFDGLSQTLGRDEPVVAPSGEGRELEFQEFVKALDGQAEAATNWIRWAERRHLVVRGAEVRCDRCTGRSWIPMASMPASVTCAGCGRGIDHPFPPRHLPFSYRLGEVLRRALEVDCLDHLFALRYFHLLLKGQGLVGLHPGVNFMERNTSDVVAEADVLMLFADGSLVPGEVKRTGAGITDDAVTKLEAVATRLESPWSFFAVGQAARNCGENVQAAECRDEGNLRFVVTTDQTYEDYPIWSLGGNPFAWNPVSEESDTARATAVSSGLGHRSPDDPWSSQGSWLLADHQPSDPTATAARLQLKAPVAEPPQEQRPSSTT